MNGKLFVISGPSGSGKTTLASHAVKSIENLQFSVSFTTRPIRSGELNGVDYFFVNEREFLRMIENGKFAEWAKVHGNLYGTPLNNIKEANQNGIDILLDIDVQGAGQLKVKFSEAVFIFVVPPSMEILEKRLKMRNSEKKDDIFLRMNVVKYEIEQSKEYDYIIINDEMNAAQNMIESIIIAERSCDMKSSKSEMINKTIAYANSAKSYNIYNDIIAPRFDLNKSKRK